MQVLAVKVRDSYVSGYLRNDVMPCGIGGTNFFLLPGTNQFLAARDSREPIGAPRTPLLFKLETKKKAAILFGSGVREIWLLSRRAEERNLGK